MKDHQKESQEDLSINPKLQEEQALILEADKPLEEKQRSLFEDLQSKARQGFLETDVSLKSLGRTA